MRLRVAISIFIIVSLSILLTFAQGAIIDIEPGATAQGRITDSFFNQRYRFQAAAGQTYTIRMERVENVGDNLDPLLFLFDNNEQFITENDDLAEGNRNAQIVFTPELEGAYIIEATRFQQEAGTSQGDFRLLLIEGDATTNIPDPDSNTPDPLSVPPQFGIPFSVLAYDTQASGTLNNTATQQYFALGGRQGEAFQITVRTSGNLVIDANVRNPNFAIPVYRSQNGTELILQGAIPQTDWHLIEVTYQSGSGSFSVEATILRDGLLDDETALEAAFSETVTTQFFVVNATINERVFVNMTVLGAEANTLIPNLALIDRSGIVVERDDRQTVGNQSRVSLTIPRSGAYILRADNRGTGSGNFSLSLRRNVPNIGKLRVLTAEYNENYDGTINDDNPIEYYRFSGKAGELVTIQMQPAELNTPLDPFLILADSNLRELAFNDNMGASRTARISQYALPADGDYFILATRPRQSLGDSDGEYEMSITVGQIALQPGSLTATLTWVGDADLNLFVRAPSGRTVSWSNPQIPEGGILQIDSNTGCETPTAQPVEHIFWSDDELETGDYTVWVWYQNVCSADVPITFTLTLAIDGEPLFVATGTPRIPLLISPGERYEAALRVLDSGNAVLTNSGSTTTPSPQQTASQGGDTLLVYSNTPVNGAITNEVYAQFYQFQGNLGDTIQICVRRTLGNLDPIVILRNSLEENIIVNDDTDGNCHAGLNYTLSETGQYVIAVTRFGLRDGTTIGAYDLTLTRGTN
jgi:hypothetical protein